MTTALVELEREHAAAQERAAEVERDRMLLDELETIRGSRSEHWDPKQTDAEYAAAFRAFGIDLDQLDPEEAGSGSPTVGTGGAGLVPGRLGLAASQRPGEERRGILAAAARGGPDGRPGPVARRRAGPDRP